MKNYEFVDHTADICIRVKAKTIGGLFKNSAAALFEIIAEKSSAVKHSLRAVTIRQKADNLEELFINWLNELLSLSSAKELIFTDFRIDALDEHNLKATAFGSAIKNHRVNVEVKAATYHRLKIKKTGGNWQAQVIFDV